MNKRKKLRTIIGLAILVLLQSCGGLPTTFEMREDVKGFEVSRDGLKYALLRFGVHVSHW